MITNNSTVRRRQDLAKVINENNYEIGLEIGVDKGQYSEIILKNSNLKKLCLVDPWMGTGLTKGKQIKYLGLTEEEVNGMTDEEFREYYGNFTLNQVKERLEPYSGRFEIIRDFSVNASSKFSDNYFDFIYIDGDHTYKACKQDVEHWWSKIRVGGCFSGHDYKNLGRAKQVKKAVDEFFDKIGVTVNKTHEACCSWWIIKEESMMK